MTTSYLSIADSIFTRYVFLSLISKFDKSLYIYVYNQV